MTRQIRRALRGWKRELGAFWGRFNTFHRVVFGIVIAMLLVYGARHHLLDPLQKEVADARTELADAGVPDHVPTPEDDEEVQQARLKVENLRRSLENKKTELERDAKRSPYRLEAGESDANDAILRLATDCGLRLQKNEGPFDPELDAALPTSAYRYEMHGRFAALLAFLKAVEREPYLWRLRNVAIELLVAADGQTVLTAGGEPGLALRFELIVFLYGKRK